MAVYIVTYDLNREVVRPKITNYIYDTYAYAKLSESSYAILSNLDPQTIYEAFLEFLDGNDSLLVITLKRPHSGQAPQAVIDWLEQELPW